MALARRDALPVALSRCARRRRSGSGCSAAILVAGMIRPAAAQEASGRSGLPDRAAGGSTRRGRWHPPGGGRSDIATIIDEASRRSRRDHQRDRPTTYGELATRLPTCAAGSPARRRPGDRVGCCAATAGSSSLPSWRLPGRRHRARSTRPAPRRDRAPARPRRRQGVVVDPVAAGMDGLDRPGPDRRARRRHRGAPGRRVVDRVRRPLSADPRHLVEARDDLAVLMFTSGTAGKPRAAMLSHGNLSATSTRAARKPASRPATTSSSACCRSSTSSA